MNLILSDPVMGELLAPELTNNSWIPSTHADRIKNEKKLLFLIQQNKTRENIALHTVQCGTPGQPTWSSVHIVETSLYVLMTLRSFSLN